MADVLLINPSFHLNKQAPTIKDKPDISSATLPLALVYLGAYLEENGSDVKCIDTRLYNSSEALLEIRKYLNDVSLVGISVKTATIPDALCISTFVKSYDNHIKVVWGGIHPTLFPLQTVEDKSIDFVIIGEGEVPLLQLSNHVKYGKPKLEEIPSLAYKREGEAFVNDRAPFLDVNELPFPAYHLLKIDRYITRRDYNGDLVRTLEIQTSRGCPYRCTFCVNTIVNKQIWRMQHPNKVLDELNQLINKYKLNQIIFLDENFFPNKNRVESILKELINHDVSWIADCRADYLSSFDGDFLKLMRKSGCKGLFIGVESGSQKILDMLKKDITIDQSINAVRVCARHDIQPYVSIMIGLPNETKEDLLKTLKLMWILKKEHPKLLWSGPQLFRPYPGGELYETCKRSGLNEPKTLKQWAESQRVSFSGYLDAFPWIKDADMLNFILDVYIYFQITNVAEYAYPDKKIKLLAELLTEAIKFRWSRNFWHGRMIPKIVRLLKHQRVLWSILGQ